MSEILVINPARKVGRKKGVKKMAKRRAKKAKRSYKRKNPNPNPRHRTRRYTKRRRRNPSSSRGGRIFSGLNFKQAIADQIPMQLGILAAMFAKKKFGPAASDYDPATWNAMSYAKGMLGTTAFAVLLDKAIKRGYGQKALVGGLTYLTNRLIRNELINRSDWAQGQFGADDDDEYMFVDTNATPYMMSGQGIYPIDDRHRLAGASLVEPGALGDDMEPIGAMGYLGEEDDDDFEAYAEDYRSF